MITITIEEIKDNDYHMPMIKTALLLHSSGTNRHFLLVLLVVFALHAAAIAAMVTAQDTIKPTALPSKSIHGALIRIEPPKLEPTVTPPPVTPKVTLPPKAAPKPQPKPQTTPPPKAKAAPSKRSIDVTPAEPEAAPIPLQTAATTADSTPPVVAPSAHSSDLHNPAPHYPRQSRRLGEQGRVLLSVLVLADGTLGAVHLKRSSGFKRLDEAALRCVKRWRFKPATRAGVALDFTYELPIDFSLH